MRLLYSIALYLSLPLVLLWLLWRSLWVPAYRSRIKERFGYVDPLGVNNPTIWVHAVSVGEVMAAAPLLDYLLQAYPSHTLLVTTSTPTGHAVVSNHYGDRIRVAYAPWDLPHVSRRFLSRANPRLLILMETELWPNWLFHCQRVGCPVLLANARLSERSARRYRRAGALSQEVFSRIDRVACQTPEMGARFLSLGVSKQALTITGSLKFDSVLSDDARDQAAALRLALAAPQRSIVIACSTHAQEEKAVLHAFGMLREFAPRSVLLLVPRHPERANSVARECAEFGFEVTMRSRHELSGPAGGVLLCDTLGELSMLCGAASAAFVGGSLVTHGGQNPLDAARWALPILMGAHTHNFEQMVAQLKASGALAVVTDGEDLGRWWQRLAADPEMSTRMGEAAETLLESNRGALKKLTPLVAQLLAEN